MKEKWTAEFVFSVIAGIIGLIIVNSVMYWRQFTYGVILDSWTDILWAANLSMSVQIAGNSLLAIYRPARIYSFIKMIEAAAGLISISVFFSVFPLDFSLVVGGWMNLLIKGVLVLGIVGSFLAIAINGIRAIAGTEYSAKIAQ
jgi:hypothetical protein